MIATWVGEQLPRRRQHVKSPLRRLDNYFVNNNQVMQERTRLPIGASILRATWFTKIEVNGTIKKANGGTTVTWISTRHREWTTGVNYTIVSVG